MAMSLMNAGFAEGQASLRALVTATAMSSMNAESAGEQEFLLAFVIAPAAPSTTAAYAEVTTLVVPT